MSARAPLEAIAARRDGEVVLQGDGRSWDSLAVRLAVEALSLRLDGRRVLAVLADNGPEWVMADLAALHAGVAHLPLPGFFTNAQMAHALDTAGADALLTDQPDRVATAFPGFAPAGRWNGLALLRRETAPAALPPGTAKISFTSGSTGTPKGACLGAAGLLETATALTERLGDLGIDRHLAVLPLALLLENVAGVYAPLLLGAQLHLPSLVSLGWRGMAGFDACALQRHAFAIGANSLILVPELLKAWTAHLEHAGEPAPGDLRYAAVGGARIDRGMLLRARAHGLPAFQGYGLTECGSVVSLNRPGDDADDVGRPLSHAAIRVDGEGEVRIATRAFLGYLDRASEDGPTEREGEFATGDLGHLDGEGRLHLDGRRKNLLITSFGRNIAPEWVESALLAQPCVAQAIVAGEGRPWLSAVLVPSPDCGSAELARAVERANASLPDYARVRGWIAAAPFSPLNGLATGNGRPIRHQIIDQHAAALAALHRSQEPSHVLH